MAIQPTGQPSGRVLVVHLIAILAISWGAYWNAIDNGFSNWDDPAVVLNNPNIQSLDGHHIARVLAPTETGTSGIPGVYRPVWTLSYALDYLHAGMDPQTYHLHSILLHSINGMLVYLLALAVGLSVYPALVAAVLFSVHPIHVEAVAWVSGRNELLLAMFFLIAFLLAVFRTHLRNGFRPAVYALSLVAVVLALLSKVTAAAFPFVLLAAYLWFLESDNRKTGCPAPCFLRHIPYVVLSAALVGIELAVTRAGVVVRPELAESRLVTWLTIPKVTLAYLASLIAPVGLSPRYDTAYVASAPGVFATLLGLLLVVLPAVWISRKSRVFGLATVWFALTFLPASNIVLLSTLRADRFLYLPSVGFCLAAGVLLQKSLSGDRPRWLTARIVAPVLAIAIVIYAGLTIRQNRVWQDSLSLWEHAVEHAPDDYMVHHNLGTVYFQDGRRADAMLAFERSIALNPNFAKAHNNLGQLHAGRGQWQEAEADFGQAVELDPEYAEAHANLGRVYAQTQRLQLAIQQFRQALERDPDRAETHLDLGQVYLLLGEKDLARAEIERSLSLGLRLERRLQAEVLLRKLSTGP